MNQETMKTVGLLAVIALVLGGLAFAANNRRLLAFETYPADTDTEGVDGCGIGGEDAKGGGAFDDLPDDGRKVGELASSQVLWMSWFKDGQSSPVTFTGRLRECGDAGIGPPEGVYYRLSYSEERIAWIGFVQDRNPSGGVRLEGGSGGFAPRVWDAPPYLYTIDGYTFKECAYSADIDTSPYYVSRDSLICAPGETRTITEGATLKVEMFTFQKTSLEGEGFWRLFAKDELVLLSALPKELEWQTGACVVGSTCILNWAIPTDMTDEGQPAYFLTILDMNTNAAIAGYDRKPLAGTSSQERIEITDAMMSNDLDTCANRLRARIYTQLIPVALDEVAVQSDKPLGGGEPPVVSNIRFDKSDYAEGDTVKVTWDVRGNATKVHVTISINGILVKDEDMSGGARETSFLAPFPGAGDAEITAYNYCTAGPVSEEHFVVGNVFPGLCTLFPGIPQCSATNILAWVAAGAAVFLVIVAFLVTIWVLAKLGSKDLPVWVGLMAGFIVAAGAAFLFLSLGWFDALLGV